MKNNEQVLSEKLFDLHYINKFASLMTLGNGYLGLRATHEEDYAEQTRGMYVAGIYNKAASNEPSDLVNLPDMAGMRIEIDGEVFSLQEGEIVSYERQLNLANGEMGREILWKSNAGARFRLVFQRFVSKNDLHLLAMKFKITSLDKEATLKVVTGIDAQQTNFGKQHLIEEKVRVFEEDIMQGVYKTTESGHTIALATSCICPEESDISFSAKNRQLQSTIKQDLAVNLPFVVEKIGCVFTSLDNGEAGVDPETSSQNALKTYSSIGYDALLAQSALKWEQFWQQKRVKITSTNEFDQLALDFALYHLEIMTPAHDTRFSVGAKGLTGEGYKGHIFWDTEIFIAPFHLYTQPETAKKLLSYRYLHLEQAKEKALLNGYEGALFPWESAFSGKEETPEFAAINIRTGQRQKVASAIAEHHIVADIAYAVAQYYENTQDDVFMKKEGLALLKETARFWITRAVEDNGRLSIKDVIGPDEYTEHVDNNAYTNYMAYYNVEKAIYFMDKFGDADELLLERGQAFLNRLYLPKPNKDQIIPQDDTFLNKTQIDLTRYKENQGSQGILLDYSRQEVNEMQILKQADVVMLLYLFPELFPRDMILENLHYYEEHTIHDSSLSKAIHAIVAARCGENDVAYRFFQEACLIDLGPDPHSSDEGLHAASLGALWLATIFGFANISSENDRLNINPKLPTSWTELTFPFHWQGSSLEILLTHQKITMTKVTGPELTVGINNEEYRLSDKIEVRLA
ncbi:glycoside hydrolase family 65 protein [Bacillus sp. V59.32b]|uniref:glycoside hydrolase family 65 protein n=1 Tax=Bacillus sp. V59.32b TaxID=1758642 RepID=UPI000E3BE1F4|nr:glycoside hydrolase family 65 protein [Bacillus sp. V59.32b]RFU63577.1 glycoside hydrolase family 65 protein [Bacillus sp. V59.32b]